MNRILFVGLCLIGIVFFVLNEANIKQKETSKKEIVKGNYQAKIY